MDAITIASAATALFPIAESFVREFNSKKANRLRKEMERILNQYDVQIEQLRNQLERKGIQFNQLMDKLAYVSPVGAAHQAKREQTLKYQNDVDTINSQINRATKQRNAYAAEKNQEISDIESRGVVRTILNM